MPAKRGGAGGKMADLSWSRAWPDSYRRGGFVEQPSNKSYLYDRPGQQALRRGRASLPHQAYLLTSATKGRQRFFAEFQVCCEACRCFEGSAILGDARMLAWVLMPDHAHWLLQLGEQDSLAVVVNRLKSASARLANRVLARRGALWEAAFHDHALRSDEDLRRVARYMVANPLRAGLVLKINDYPFWNAIWP